MSEAPPEVSPASSTVIVSSEVSESGKLVRHIGLGALVLYGIGDMVGAGIYATIGKAAAQLGNAVWLAFATSMCAAMLTALSYACLASRYPRAAGAAYVTQRAFRLTPLSYVLGLTVMASGLTSMATSSNAVADSVLWFLPDMDRWVAIVLFVGLLTAINFWGIRESMWANALCTLVEVGGLLFVIAVGMRYLGSVNYLETPPSPEGVSEGVGVSLILSGAVLTFFAFVGFEDMLNVSEEVKNPRRNMPWGIVFAILGVTVLYILISLVSVSVVNYRDLGDAALGAPLTQITAKAAPWLSPWVFTAITLFAVSNSSLLNYVMGSRLAYGMARQGLLPRLLGRVHPKRHTPHVAIFCLMVVVLVLAMSGSVVTLAKATAMLLLSVFTVVNAALVVLKLRKSEPKGMFEVPVIVPVLGAIVCMVLVAASLFDKTKWTDPNDATKWGETPVTLMVALCLLVGIGVLYAIQRPKAIPEEELPEPE